MTDTLVELQEAIRNFDEETAEKKTRQALEEGIDPEEAITAATDVLGEIGEKFDNGDLFLFDLVSAGDAMNSSREILEEAIISHGGERDSKGKVVLGTVEGDIHDIGKQILGALLSANGYEVFDLGVEVPASEFINKFEEIDADAVGASALLTTTKEKQKELVQTFESEGIRDDAIIMVGGAPVTEEWKDKIGADIYGETAFTAVKKLNEKQEAIVGG